MDPRITRLYDAQPCGVIRDGFAMALVRLEDAHAAHQTIQILEASVAHLERDRNTLTETKDRLVAEVRDLKGRISHVINSLS